MIPCCSSECSKIKLTCYGEHSFSVMSPRKRVSVSTATLCEMFSKLIPFTDSITSPCLIRPSLAAVHSGITDLIHMGRSPLGLPLPPATENPNPLGPLVSLT